MIEQFAPTDLADVSRTLHAYEARCEELMQMLGGKRALDAQQAGVIAEQYRSLKGALKSETKALEKRDRSGTLNRVEKCFTYPAIRRAALALMPATNSNPIMSGWYSAVDSARLELSYALAGIEKCRPAD